MIYRRWKATDVPKIKEMLRKHDIKYDAGVPFVGFIAETEQGELQGFILAHACALIEPFVCDNPTIGVKLYNRMMGALSALNSKVTLAHVRTSNEKLHVEMERVGFKQIPPEDFRIFKLIEE